MKQILNDVHDADVSVVTLWKICLCQEIRTQYPTYDDPNTGSHLVVLWRIPYFMRNRRWSELSTRFTLTWLQRVVCLWFCERCGNKMRPSRRERLRRLWFLCVWNTSTSTGFWRRPCKGRLSKAKRMFKKGYLPNWTEELFTIVRCIETRPPVFLIKDDHGEILEGTFYGHPRRYTIRVNRCHSQDWHFKPRRLVFVGPV
jgi:hypothetical protein